MERFFDESGGTQLVIHSPFGSRINRAWGNRAAQALLPQFQLRGCKRPRPATRSSCRCRSRTLRARRSVALPALGERRARADQALLDAPMFGVRWRWNATTALALPRFTGGKRTAPQLQRMKSDDLLATVFPDQVACLENIVGEREIRITARRPDARRLPARRDGHRGLACAAAPDRNGAIELVARDLPAPSPLAAEILNAKPTRSSTMPHSRNAAGRAVAPLERSRIGRRSRRSTPTRSMPCATKPAARARRRRNARRAAHARVHRRQRSTPTRWLARPARGTRRTPPCDKLVTPGDAALWVPVERLVCMRALHPDARIAPALRPAACAQPWEADAALVDVIARGSPASSRLRSTRSRHRSACPCVGRDGTRGAGTRRLCDARPVHAGHNDGRMVRTPSACAFIAIR